MAPSRRKGASKAAATAAARRQWKVGDLVLAKVKGFPAWPATVSAPEKWGYAPDWKKILVYFFGTKQIAFCNPADVEEFNEEKKESLMGKRQGRSSDFVRAVQEIVDCYEKLKESNHADQLSSGDGSAENAADGDLDGCKTTVPEASHDSGLKPSSPKPKDDESVEVGALMEVESLHQMDPSEEPVDNVVAPGVSQPHTYTLRKKSRRSQSKRCARQKNFSVQRSRSLLRSDSRGSQNGDLHCSDGKKSGEGGINGFWDGPSRRAKRSKRSPDGCAPTAGSSPICNSNGTVEDNGSDVAMLESETLSNNEGSDDEINRKLEHYDLHSGSCDGLELSRRLDLQVKSAIVRKKRNPGRRRVLNDASETASRLELDAKLEVVLQKDSSVPVISCENAIDSHLKNEGDEHLPLVKRARVRMGKLLSEEKQQQLDSLVESEERHVERHSTSVSSEPDAPVNCDNTSLNGSLTLNNSVSSLYEDKCTKVSDNKLSEKAYTCVVNEPMACLESENCAWVPENKPQPWKIVESQAFVCAVDGEAALPPSKRHHRALEAMSANSVEVKQLIAEAPLCEKTDVKEHIPSVKICSDMLVEDKVVNDTKLPVDSVQCSDISNDDCVNVAHSSDPMACDIIIKSSGDMPMSDSTNKLPDSARVGSPRDSVDEVAVSGQDKNICGFYPIDASDNALQGQASQAFSTSISGLETVVESVETIRSLPAEDVSKAGTEECNCVQENNEVSAVHSDGGTNPIPREDGASADGHHDGVFVGPSDRETNCLASELVKTTADEGTQATSMCQPMEDHHAAEDVNIQSSILLTSKVSSMQQTCRDLASVCPSHGQDDTTITTRTFSAGQDVSQLVSQPNDVMNATNKNNDLQHVEYGSTDAKLPQKKCVSSDECNSTDPMNLQSKSGERISLVEVKAALASLELTLGSLTRTKESIGRATRIAVDCVKFGIATEVVELLSLYLEKESSMHRRVDLFFLVDSIAQCCRSMKGEIGGTYFSAVKETLGRMVSAAAPSGHAGRENRRQCLKVLRLWLERRILPDTAVRQHIRELESQNSISSTGGFCRRMSRTERSFDDPLRDMEGMFVDEYGSNSSFQLPGFCMPRMLEEEEDDGSDSDGGSFEAVTPEHDSGNKESREVTELPSIEKHRRILEDVDGELEMEDVAPCDVDNCSAATSTGNALMNTHCSIPPLPHDVPRAPPLPTSPPPLPPPPPPPPPLVSHAPTISHVSVDSQLHAGINTGQEAVLALPPAPGYHLPMQMPDSTPSCSYNSYPVMHPPVPPGNNLQQADANLYGKPYPRPPYPSPSNQFSYFPADHQVRPPREAPPPSYYDRPHYSQNLEGGHSYGDQESIRAPRHEFTNGWGYSRPPYPTAQGPVHSENDQAYPMYTGSSCEPGRPHDHGWAYPPHPVHHPNHIPGRPPCDGPVPVGVRGPGYWRPR